MVAFNEQPGPLLLLTACDQSLFILMTRRQQLLIQRSQISRLWNRNPMIAPEVSRFALNPAFLLWLSWCAELGAESPMRTKGNEASGFLYSESAQYLLYG